MTATTIMVEAISTSIDRVRLIKAVMRHSNCSLSDGKSLVDQLDKGDPLVVTLKNNVAVEAFCNELTNMGVEFQSSSDT